MRTCKVKNCNREYHCKGYCGRHNAQIYLYGEILKRTRSDRNKIIKYKNYAVIVLYSKLNKKIAQAKIDKEDISKIKKYKWCLSNNRVVTHINNSTLKLHQLILGKKRGYEIDHVNCEQLDNRRINLRFATHGQNSMNRKCKGYYFNKRRDRWFAKIVVNSKQIYLGYFKKESDAIKARKAGEKKYFGEFAFKN